MKAIRENIVLEREVLLLAYVYRNENFNVPLHFHPEYELVYIVKGTGTRYVGDSIEPFEEGDLVFLAPNTTHCWRNDVGSTAYCESLVIQWKSSLVENHPELSALKPLFNDSLRGLQFESSETLFQQMLTTIKAEGMQQYIHFLQLLQQLSVSRDKRYICSTIRNQKITPTTSERLNAIFNYIEGNYQNKIHLELMAARVGLAESAFSRFFSKAMGKPFFTFLNEYRIHRVCKLLQEKDLTVSDACYQCGFDSLPYFHRQFKKFKSITPYQYKKDFVRSYRIREEDLR